MGMPHELLVPRNPKPETLNPKDHELLAHTWRMLGGNHLSSFSRR